MNKPITAPASASIPSESQRAVAAAMDEAFHSSLSKLSMGLSPLSLALAFTDWALHLGASPGRQMLLAQRAAALSQHALGNVWQPAAGGADNATPPVTEIDSRFSDPAWRQWPFNALKESYKAGDAWWREAAEVDGMTPHHQHVVDFFTRQTLDALSPSNWALTNPEVFSKGWESSGQSWIKGYQSYARDMLEHHHRRVGTSQIKPLDYQVGKDVAVTPGKVVFRNKLIELIQYLPSTDKVRPEPLLIVSSPIMKYYILDLSPSNSMVRYLVGQGYTVFIISWRNPDASDRELGMHDYLQTGVMEAMAAVKQRANSESIHAIGYCLGGTFLSIVAAALGRRGPQSRRKLPNEAHRRQDDAAGLDQMPKLATVTLLAAQTDFTEPGELGVFIDDDQLKTLRAAMARTGYLSGRQMAGSFQFLNSRELVWSRNTHRYLLGQEEGGNDMMSWNADLTRLPERMHNEYLSSLFLNNALASGNYSVAGVGVALRDIKAPMLVVGTVRDHVSPWRSVYKIHLFVETPITFILTVGGHNAGIVSEPGHRNRSYQINSVEQGHDWNDPDVWVAEAPVHEGSWWEALDAWLRERSGKSVAPPAIDPACVLGDAPGEYIMVRHVD